MVNPANKPKYLRIVRSFLELTKPNLGLVVVSTVFLAISSILEGISLGLIVPVLDMLIKQGEFSLALQIPYLQEVLQFIPHLKFRYAFLVILGCILSTVIVRNFLVYASELLASELSRKMEHALRVKIFDRYLSFSKIYFDKNKIGNMADLAINQVIWACEILRNLNHLLLSSFLLLVYLMIMMLISWKLTLIAFALLPGVYFVTRIVSRKVVLSTDQKFHIDQKMSAYLYDTLSNMTLIRSYNNETVESSTYHRISDDSRKNFHSVLKKILFAPHVQDVILTTTIVILITLCVFVFFKERVAGLSGFLTFFIALRRFSLNLSMLGNHYIDISKGVAPMRRILTIFEDDGKFFIRSGHEKFEGLRDKIEFKNVFFGYEGMHILKGIHLTIPKGRMTALVGATGAGKTTLVNMIPRFYDVTEGAVELDGVNIKNYSLASLRAKIAIVDQDSHIFNTTIKENILYGLKEKIAEEELYQVSKKASLHEFVMGLPEQYDTLVGDRGVRLSGGEKQRLAIARALLKNPEIIIFDEATSSLDVETEQSIQQAIENVTVGRTVIVIAHRLSTIKNAGQIAVVDQGQIMEQGSFRELLDRKGFFFRYWQLQYF